jgi:phosphomannomutase
MTDTVYMFDVDGTLTDPRRQIVPEFKDFMHEFVKQHTCMIVTGSDRPKTIEQIGEELTNSFARVYHCSGNHVFVGNKEVYKSDWSLSEVEHTFLQAILHTFDYPEMTGNHIEQRTGTANFSIVGRNADWDQRARYAEWEKVNKGRDTVAMYYNQEFTNSIAQVAGQTSIDIFKTGCDKSQAIREQKGKTIYFGDHCNPGGNDFTAAQASTHFHQIDQGYKQTWEILKNIQ